ncbi:MAG TPA: hypothetical protein VFV34_19595 [Blastocatellia bacterium]|nr:hypothetical protein [Blastocatellia bacterium]
MAAKKKAAKKAAKISLGGAIPKVTLQMPLDDKKIAAIKRCIAKGTLKITLSRVDLAGGRLGDAWLYD